MPNGGKGSAEGLVQGISCVPQTCVDAGEAANPQHTFKNIWRAEPRRTGESRDLTDCFFFQLR